MSISGLSKARLGRMRGHGRLCRARRGARSGMADRPAGRGPHGFRRRAGDRRSAHPARHDLPHLLDDQARRGGGGDDPGGGVQAAAGRAGGPPAAGTGQPPGAEAARWPAGRDRPGTRPITVRDLLTFTMGFGLVFAPPDAYPTRASNDLALGQGSPPRDAAGAGRVDPPPGDAAADGPARRAVDV